MLKIVIATRNAGKLKEISEKLKDYPVVLVSLLDYPQIPEIEEKGTTFSENAFLKASTVSHYTNLPALADDSGLEIDCLDGKPGIYSSRWGKTDEERIEKVLKAIQETRNKERKARFVCAMCLVILEFPENNTLTSEGICYGKVTNFPQGDAGFGYDPIFMPDGYNLTFSQLGVETKNKISHRAKALDEILPQIIAYFQLK